MVYATTTTFTSKTALATLFLAASANAHIGIWLDSAYGFNASGIEPEHWFDAPVNTNFLKNPLRLMDNLKWEEWFMHGLRGATPNKVTELPAGGKIMIEHSCNKAWTSYGLVQEQKDFIGNMPCDINVIDGKPTYGVPTRPAANGPMHVADIDDAKGCGLAIAYTDDVWSIKPEDFTVFSVNHTCVWYKDTYFDIPEDMPPCPDGKKCICSWNWIHGSRRLEGYGNELYMVGFDCTITNSKSNKPLAKPKVAKDCRDDSTQCVKGAKQGLWWQGAQKEGWNIPDTSKPNLPMIPPAYNMEYGFADGAQNDIFSDSGSVDSGSDKSSSSSSSSAVASRVDNDDNNVAPTAALQNHVALIEEDGSTSTLEGPIREKILTSTIVKTRTHVATVTAKSDKVKKMKRAPVLDDGLIAAAAAQPRMRHQRRGSAPHRL